MYAHSAGAVAVGSGVARGAAGMGPNAAGGVVMVPSVNSALLEWLQAISVHLDREILFGFRARGLL